MALVESGMYVVIRPCHLEGKITIWIFKYINDVFKKKRYSDVSYSPTIWSAMPVSAKTNLEIKPKALYHVE